MIVKLPAPVRFLICGTPTAAKGPVGGGGEKIGDDCNQSSIGNLNSCRQAAPVFLLIKSLGFQYLYGSMMLLPLFTIIRAQKDLRHLTSTV